MLQIGTKTKVFAFLLNLSHFAFEIGPTQDKLLCTKTLFHKELFQNKVFNEWRHGISLKNAIAYALAPHLIWDFILEYFSMKKAFCN